MFLSKFSQTKTNTGSFVLYPDLGKSSGSAFRNTAANQCGGSGSVGIISLDPDPYKKKPGSGIRILIKLYGFATLLPTICQGWALRAFAFSTQRSKTQRSFFSNFLRKVCKVRNILLGFISCKKFEKRTLKFFDRVKKNARSFKKNQHSFWVS